MKRLALISTSALLLLVACGDVPEPVAPPTEAEWARAPNAPEQVAAWFRLASPEVLALPHTVLAHHDERTNRLVVGVENAAAMPAVERALQRLGIPGDAYSVEVTEPFYFVNTTLQSEHRPTLGGIQIHWSQGICTLGFNVDHPGGRSFITNSHCTETKGATGSTRYFQPEQGLNPDPVAIEADDPPYFRRGDCPQGRRCRYSDAARALYVEGVGSLGRIARTDGAGTGSLEVVGSFDITGQDDSTTSFERGTRLHKVGRTTGWTSGTTWSTCVNLNVAYSNYTLLCQTTVLSESGEAIVAGGDSGSPVFRRTSDDEVELVGILALSTAGGGSFAFSPLKNIQDELGPLVATTDGVGGGEPQPPVPETGTVAGAVTDAATGEPIENTTIGIVGTDLAGITGVDGTYSIGNVPGGGYTVTASAAGFEPASGTVTVTGGETSTLNFALEAAPGGPDPEAEPVIEHLVVTTRSSGPWNRASVDWTVSHEGGTLASVTSELLDGTVILDSRSTSTSGFLASGQHDLRTRSHDGPLVVRFTVRDSAGNETSAERSVEF